MFKKIGLIILTLVIGISGFIVWFFSLLGNELKADFSQQQPQDIRYISEGVNDSRGRILAVLTSEETLGATGKTTGYELTELARAFYVFQANGFSVDIASVQGGEPPMVIDTDDMGKFDYAFLNDDEAMHKVKNSFAIESANLANYDGIYFVGGKGAMFDFSNNAGIKAAVSHFWQTKKVIVAVCHGPAAFVDVVSDTGQYFLENKRVSAFTNSEELFLIPNAKNIFPFLLETKLSEQGATFIAGENYLNQVSVHDNLITGQNPWSVWEVAEETVKALGYKPLPRVKTAEENSIQILTIFVNQGQEDALRRISEINQNPSANISRLTIATHALVAGIKGELYKSSQLLTLLNAVE
ncbi:Intracellular protease/amidase-like protein [Alteromonas sp. 38]|uniref:type 1 glutamine amidotransferase domain-containing protein n=1 Tax=Alteromonas TaxID=226 RepID=UPI0012F3728B|nr:MULTISPECIES: type 1 glutamine amidotransferase domain-containing protein [Alteromonas]CAD5275401.1 Intracellular protease/amidase-like protein [Alteromonas sp. 154]VXB64959.1 Intracellular protease/amidase-like protein [Alteromonas sp. 38]